MGFELRMAAIMTSVSMPWSLRATMFAVLSSSVCTSATTTVTASSNGAIHQFAKCSVDAINHGNRIVVATVVFGAISIVFLLAALLVIYAHRKDRKSLRDRILIGVFISNLVFSVGNTIPYNYLNSSPQNLCKLPILAGAWNGCIGEAFFMAGKFSMGCYEIFIIGASILTLKTGSTTMPAASESAIHFSIFVVGVIPFVWFMSMCVPNTDEQNAQIAGSQQNSDGNWTISQINMYNDASTRITDMTARLIRVWTAVLAVLILSWMYQRWLLNKLIKQWNNGWNWTQEQLNRDNWESTPSNMKYRMRKETLLKLQLDAYVEVGKPLERYLIVLVLCSTPGIVMATDFCINQSNGYQDLFSNGGAPCQTTCEFVLSLRAFVAALVYFYEKSAREALYDWRTLFRKGWNRFLSSVLWCMPITREHRVKFDDDDEVNIYTKRTPYGDITPDDQSGDSHPSASYELMENES